MLGALFRRGSYLLSPRSAVKAGLFLVVGAGVYPALQAKFDLYYNEDNPSTKEIIESCPHIKWGYFFPTFYLGHGLLQAWFGSISKTFDRNVEYKEQVISLPCGSQIALHWAKYKEEVNSLAKESSKEKILVILPGMTASSQEPYIVNLVSEALRHKYQVVVYHPRGLKAELTLPKDGFIDPVEDFKHAVEQIRAAYPSAMMIAAGHSYGANTLVNYLGKYNKSHPFKAAASVANPFDFLKAGSHIKNTYSDSYLTKSAIKLTQRQKETWKSAPQHMKIDIEKALSAKSILDFDQYLTCRYMGYDSNMAYYSSVSSQKHLRDVNIPLLCMNSRDDPILHHSSIPVEECKQNPNILLLVTNNGGHVGWFEGTLQPKRWFPKPVMEYLDAVTE